MRAARAEDLYVLFPCVREAGVMAPSPHQRPLANDDLLAGFDQTGPSQGSLRGFFATAAGASLYAWNVAFEYGAYHAFFYHRRQQLLVLSLVVLFGGLIMRRRARFRWWLLAVFAPPIVVVLLQLAEPVRTAGPVAEDLSDVITIGYVVLAPLGLWIVARLLAPQYFTLPDRQSKIGVIAIVAAVALTGFLVGKYNNHFLTCGDFKVAGQHEPANCVHGRRE
jgi:hypothetical protein